MEQKIANDEIEIDIGEIISVLMSKLWLILFMGVVGAMVMLIVSKFIIAPIYSSTTEVYVLNKQEQNASTVTYTDLQTGTQLTKDYVELITSRTVLTQVIAELGLKDLSISELEGMVSVTNKDETRIISITVNHTDAYEAQQIANKIREIAAVQICSVMNIEAVNVVDEANIPTAPSSPNVAKNTLLGAIVGVFLAVAFVLIRFFMDDTIKSPDDVERYLGLSVLGSIPVLDDNKKARKFKEAADFALEDEPIYQEYAEEDDEDVYYEYEDEEDDDYTYEEEDY